MDDNLIGTYREIVRLDVNTTLCSLAAARRCGASVMVRTP
jgi:hypothetical protein